MRKIIHPASRILALLMLAALFLSSASFAQPGSSAVPPNVLMIVYDDLDISGDLEPYGAPAGLSTPFSQKLADQGKKFESFYTNAAICSPTRIGLQAGLYPTQLGFNFATGDLSWRGIPGDVPTLGRLFSDMGFRTGAFGKWHAGKNEPDHYPAGAGFDTSAIDCTYLNILPSDMETMDEIDLGRDFGDDYFDAIFCDAPQSILPDSELGTYATTYTVDKTLEFIADALDSAAGSPPGQNSDPFFAQVWLHAPHLPLTCPLGVTCPDCNPDIPQKPDNDGCSPADARFYFEAVVEQAEAQLMRLHDDLVARGVWDDTIVILTSDNGGVKNTQLAGASLKGNKGATFERGIRTPFLVRGPGITQGTVTEPVIGHDLLATLADHFNESLPDYDGPGESFSSLIWSGGTPWQGADRPLFWELSKKAKTAHVNFFPFLQYAVRKEVRGKPWKMVQGNMANGVIPELFDFSVDPGESNNLGFQETAVRNHLLDELSNWRVTHNAYEPEVANLVGAVTQNGDSFTFSQPALGGENGMVELEDHPILTIGDQDFSISFTFDASSLSTTQPAYLVDRFGAWEIFIGTNRRMTFRIRYSQNNGQQVWGAVEASAVPIQAGRTYRITAVSEATRGLSLYIDDILAKAQLPTSPVKKTDSPVTVGRRLGGGAPFFGTISDMVVHPLALRTVDLELDDAYATGFEDSDDQPFTGATTGSLDVVSTDAFRGTKSLKHRAGPGGSFTLPFAQGSAIVAQKANDIEYQLSVWVKGKDGEETVSLYLLCIDAAGEWNWPGSYSFSHHLATTEWQRITHQHQCPTGTESLSFRLDNNIGDQVVYWDEVSIGYIGKARLNEHFEDYMNGDAVTSVFAADGFSASSAKARSGSISMEIPQALMASSTHWVPVTGENHFITSFWASTETGIGKVRVKFCCQNTAAASCIETLNSIVVPDDWQRYQLWDSCPAGTTQVGIRLSTEKSNEPVLIDDLSLTTTADPY